MLISSPLRNKVQSINQALSLIFIIILCHIITACLLVHIIHVGDFICLMLSLYRYKPVLLVCIPFVLLAKYCYENERNSGTSKHLHVIMAKASALNIHSSALDYGNQEKTAPVSEFGKTASLVK